MLKNPTWEIPLAEENSDDCTFVVKPVAILDCVTKNAYSKKIELVVVYWSEDPHDVAWELQDLMKCLYLELFHFPNANRRVTRRSRRS